eukprot:CAMPEP_0197843402 /NCGR_PEP_ID=MMETSP1438-20131217/278_1 /TAXON_ID=1461541 /ORGANISM="Pterosperma sp., Strain CCMP1384" /LENGTH=380 /DNA_ID=CAMNT_0043453525 /DNA_START=135 /DNA_END=1277 /DNA_ORIENTATION=+
MENESEKPEVLSVRFNQDSGCFACGTDSGFRIYNCDPFQETFRREEKLGGIGQVEMLFRCNILALVGGGRNPKYPPNKVMIWDDHQGRCIGELSFRSEVRGVRLRRDRIVVVLEHKIYVYNFADLKLLHQIETIANQKGICALSPNSSQTVLACPGLHRGEVRVELYDVKKTRFITAHDGALSCIALTLDGTRLATASEKGTLVRVFDSAAATKLQEFRRGADQALIYSLAFSPDVDYLAVSSDKGTVHIYQVGPSHGRERSASTAVDERQQSGATASSPTPGEDEGEPTTRPSSASVGAGNQTSGLSFMRGLLPKYFSSEWSFAKFKLQDEHTPVVVAFAKKNSITIVGKNGAYYRCSFDPVKGGDCKQEAYDTFVNLF